MPTQLHRFGTYPPAPQNESNIIERKFQDESGLFHLKMNPGSDFNFELITPSGATIFDNLHWIEDREYLYRLLNKNIFEFLKKSFEEKLGEVMVNADGYTIMKVIDLEQYIMTVDRDTKSCRLEYPARQREFDIDDIYSYDNFPDLPMLYDGTLDQHFRDELESIGIKMPAAPYLPMLKLTPKKD